MKKKLLLFLFMLGSFIFCVSSIKAINITCGSTECSNATFSITQLTSTNTASGQSYSGYASHFQSYYQSTAACIKTDDGCTALSGAYSFTMNWTSANGFSAQSNKKFVNLENAIKTSASYTKAGTYVFLVKQTSVSTGATKDSTEYIVYVNVKSDLSIGSAVAKRIKNSSGSAISAEKVSSLTFSLSGVYPVTFAYTGGSVSADFYVRNDITGEYADLSKTILFQISINGIDKTVEAQLYNQNGCVKTNNVCTKITFSSTESYKDITLKAGEALVFPKGSLKLGYKIWSVTYNGITGEGYNLSLTTSSNGKSNTYTNDNGASHYGSTLGGTGANYITYTWNYPDSNVPNAGVIIKVLPYVVMVGAVLAVGLLFVLTRKRKITDITE